MLPYIAQVSPNDINRYFETLAVSKLHLVALLEQIQLGELLFVALQISLEKLLVCLNYAEANGTSDCFLSN